MPNVFGKESKKKELVNNLGEIYQKIEREHQISPGDFPNLRKMQVQPPPCPGSRLVGIGMRTAWGTGAVILEGTPAPRGGASQSGSSTPPNRKLTRGEVDPGHDTSQGNVVTHPEG